MPALEWRESAGSPALGPGAVHVWRVCPDAILDDPGLGEHLSAEERSQVGRFLHGSGQRSFAAHRGLLRVLAGRYLGADPASLAIRPGPHGKPELAASGGGEPLHFSLSHTRGLSLFAFSGLGGVGVDVEFIDPDLDPERLAAWITLPAARSRLLVCPAVERVAAFHSAWTLQEAWAKAAGLGLGRWLDGPEGGGPGAERAETAAGLTVLPLDAGPGYAAAIAFPGEDVTLEGWRWP